MKRRIVYIDNFLVEHGYTPATGATLTALFAREGYDVVRAGTKKNKVARLLEMLAAIIRNRQAVVLIAVYSTSAFYFAWACAQLCRLIGAIYIPCLHGGNLPERVAKSPVLCRQIFARSYTNVVVSGYLQQCIAEKKWPSVLIPNSINIKLYPFLLRSQIQPKLLWVRSFHAIYNPALAIKLVKALLPKYPSVLLTMVGPDKDGSMEKCKTLAVELGVSGNIHFTGRLSQAGWAALSASHDVFINTTNFDNLPVSVIEAMALGMPVVSTDAGGLKYLVKNRENGMLAGTGDVAAFQLAVEALLVDAGLTAGLSQAARQTAETFDELHVLQAWHTLLKGP
ncbi:MAG TPA: glycosyltransferase family 4 protein [Chitinophagaceae bacterium]|nr:glycosyltransferase family 4 protein [Chitinophagaceae bacterium]